MMQDRQNPTGTHPLEALEVLLPQLPGAEARLGRFLLDHADQIPFESTETIAAKANVSRMALWRLCRKLGYENFSGLKQALRQTGVSTPWLSGETYQHYLREAASGTPLREALANEIAALEAAYTLTSTTEWAESARLLAGAERVWVAGFRIGHSLARLVGNGLKMFRPGVILVDADGGDFADVFMPSGASECVVLVALHTYSPASDRHHSAATIRFARKVREAGKPLIVISDPRSGWAREVTPLVLTAEIHNGLFWGTLGPLTSLCGLLVDAVIRERNEAVQERLAARMALFDEFEGDVAKDA